MALWTNGGWSWNFQWKRPLRAWEDDKMQQMLEDINHIKLMQDAEDTWSWRIDTKGKYTTRSAYEQLTRKEDTRLLEHKKLWGAQVPSKVSAFSWQLLLDRIPTKVNLAKRGVVDGNQNINCVWCDSSPEHTDHLFLSCNTSFKLWTRCLSWWGVHYALGNTCMDVSCQHIWFKGPKILRKSWNILWFAIVWTIWLSRNETTFQLDLENGRVRSG
ncbi:hypothetical protein SLE2022_048560 [Rubroshorea leprosula]